MKYILISAFIIASNFFLICFSLTKRGPHHPRSELSKTKTNKVDQHLTHEEHNIENDLEKWGLNVNPDELSEEEKHFYYFKVHDSDNNNALDGLEMLHAALHQDENIKKLERDMFLENTTNELNHIIKVIDDFIDIADLNNDGFLQYPEYIKAVNDGNVKDIEEETPKNK